MWVWAGADESIPFLPRSKSLHTHTKPFDVPTFSTFSIADRCPPVQKRKNFNQFFIQDFQRHNCAPLDGKFVGGQSGWKLFAVRKQRLVRSHLLCFLPRHCLSHFVCGCVSFDFFSAFVHHTKPIIILCHTHPHKLQTLWELAGKLAMLAGVCVCVCARAVPATTSTEV